MLKPICRHCNRLPVNRPRGLCWGCYYTPGVKDLFPITSKYASRGYAVIVSAELNLPAEPTDAPPGSLAKMRVMQQRIIRGESPFHPRDNRVVVWDLLTPFGPVFDANGRDNGRKHGQPTGLEDDFDNPGNRHRTGRESPSESVVEAA